MRLESIRSVVDWGRFYFEALGRFIEAYAHAEYAAHSLLVHLTGMKPKVANAALSGTKVDGALSFMRRIYAATETSIPSEIEEAFTRLAVLNTSRNELVHLGTFIEDSWRVVSNEVKAHTPSKVKRWRITTETLKHMENDAIKIASTLTVYRLPALRQDEAHKRALSLAWQYTPPTALPSLETKWAKEDQRNSQALRAPRGSSRK